MKAIGKIHENVFSPLGLKSHPSNYMKSKSQDGSVKLDLNSDNTTMGRKKNMKKLDNKW